MDAFSGATLLITGGTGSFGNAVLRHFLDSDIGQIRIFSRDGFSLNLRTRRTSPAYSAASI